MRIPLTVSLALALALLTIPLSALATPTCSMIQEKWYSHYVRDTNVTWDTRNFSCNHPEGIFALALYDLENIELTADENGNIPNFYKIIRKDLRSISNHLGKTGTCKTALAYEQGGKITLCPAFYTDSRVDRASTLAHESRHLNENDPGHVKCVGGAHNGDSGACDKNFTDGSRLGGGYNADVHYTGHIVNNQIGNELSRSVAQSYINRYVPDRFNNITPAQIQKWHKIVPYEQQIHSLPLDLEPTNELPAVTITATRTHHAAGTTDSLSTVNPSAPVPVADSTEQNTQSPQPTSGDQE